MSNAIDTGFSSEDSDDDVKIGFIEQSAQTQSDALGLGSWATHVGVGGPPVDQKRVLPSSFTGGNGRVSAGATGMADRSILPRPFANSQSEQKTSCCEDEASNGVDLPSGGTTLDDTDGADFDDYMTSMIALQNLSRPKLEDDLEDGILSVPLLKHQKIALAWMVDKERSRHCAGGILADDQGLGKTFSMIALILKQMEEQDEYISSSWNKSQPSHQASTTQYGPFSNKRPAAGTLVICPASVLKQWADELADKVTEASRLSVLVYHGGTRTQDPEDLAKYDVVVTTYTIVTNEVPKLNAKDHVNNDYVDAEQRDLERHGASPEFAPNGIKRKPPAFNNKRKGKRAKGSDLESPVGPLSRVRWFRVVLDEAHTIKNHDTQVARACCGLRARRRWCMSGTPIQNSIDDLYSYFRFLKFEPYSVYSSFESCIKHLISRDSINGYQKLQAVMRTLLLRRRKDTCINGALIINIPPKSVCLNKVEFSPEERAFYVRLEESSRRQFKGCAAAGTLKQNYASILLLLLRLRQACDHPLLAQNYQSNTVCCDSFDIAKKLPRDVIISLLHCLECPPATCGICSDPPEDAVVTMCGHVFCYKCVHHQRLSSDETICPTIGCRDSLHTNSIFSKSILKACVSDNAGPTVGTIPDPFANENHPSIIKSGYISSKIKAAVDDLIQICEQSDNAGPFKAIVFSQWTSMLDLLELSSNKCMIQYRRLDGTMSLVARDRSVKDFNINPEVRVMLMSLKAGNLGLNMVAACHVILVDLWWNPYAEDQAIDRAHRILALQEKKRKMVLSAFGEDGGRRATRLTFEDLRYLFLV